MSIRTTATRTVTDVLDTVSAVATTISSTTMIASDLAQTGRAYSHAYLIRTQRSLELDEDEIQFQAEDDAKHRQTKRKLELEERMKDENYARIYNSLKIEPNAPTEPAVLHAAE